MGTKEKEYQKPSPDTKSSSKAKLWNNSHDEIKDSPFELHDHTKSYPQLLKHSSFAAIQCHSTFYIHTMLIGILNSSLTQLKKQANYNSFTSGYARIFTIFNSI